MTESEWLACTDPKQMLWWITPPAPSSSSEVDLARWRQHPSDRKLWLFVAGVERSYWGPEIGRANLKSIAILEAVADARIDTNALQRVVLAYPMPQNAPECATECLRIHDYKDDRPRWAALLRDIIGNPWRPVRLPREVLRLNNVELVGRCPWLTPDVLRLAQVIYDTRDFAALPILADALEDIGCDNEPILAHCRGQCLVCKGTGQLFYFGSGECDPCEGTGLIGPHARGCWALDLVLGKE